MSADFEGAIDSTNGIPTTAIRSRSQFARRIHRQHSNRGEPMPACGEMYRDTDFKECYPQTLLEFSRWRLCDNPEYFGEGGIARSQSQEVESDQ